MLNRCLHSDSQTLFCVYPVLMGLKKVVTFSWGNQDTEGEGGIIWLEIPSTCHPDSDTCPGSCYQVESCRITIGQAVC